jgi:hypothetical protein
MAVLGGGGGGVCVSCWWWCVCVVPLVRPARCLAFCAKTPDTNNRMVNQKKRGLCVDVVVLSEAANKRPRQRPVRFRSSPQEAGPVSPPACRVCTDELARLVSELRARLDAMDDRQTRADCRCDDFDREFDKRADYEADRRRDIVADDDAKILRVVDTVLEEVAEQMTGMKSKLEKTFRAAIKAEADQQDVIVEDAESQLVYQVEAVERIAARDLAVVRQKVDRLAYEMAAVEAGTADDLSRVEAVVDRVEEMVERHNDRDDVVEKKIMADVRANHDALRRLEVVVDRNGSSVKLEKDYQDGVGDDVDQRQKTMHEEMRAALAAQKAMHEEVRANRNALNRVEGLVTEQVGEMKMALVGELQSALDIVAERVD